MTFYLKYRPQNLEELDLESVRESLKKIVASGKLPHAFLFAGPKGTGKTSAARILAKIINCEKGKKEPCDKCDQCTSTMKGNNIDVIELDAASHRGIDDVRALRDAVKLAPAKAKKKVYIIDEAHMLTTEASNALLKTLEEPPEHVVFVLATTNPEKLIETIRSRATFIPFKKAGEEEIVRSLGRVVKGEKIKIDKDALRVIARTSDGAFRDAVKILEQLISEKKDLSVDFLEEYLFQQKIFDLENFIELLAKKDTQGLVGAVDQMVKKGGSPENFVSAILFRLRNALLAKVGVGGEDLKDFERKDLVCLIELLTEASKNISDSPIEELPVEIAIIKWCGASQNSHSSDNAGTGHDSGLAQTVASGVRKQTTDAAIIRRAPALKVKTIGDEVWKMILTSVRPINASIEALLRAARPIGYDGSTLTLGVFYKFHKERLEDGRNRRILEDIIAQILKSPTRVICTLTEPPPKKVIEETKTEAVLTEGEDQDIIKVAEEIFGN